VAARRPPGDEGRPESFRITHRVIRVGHAFVLAWRMVIGELAHGLVYWVATGRPCPLAMPPRAR
jgi:hypothetical protein